MSRFFTVLVAMFLLVLGSTTASAQDTPMPGRGVILELRRDDPRYQEGYRSFIYGNWVSGMPGLNDLLDRVNADQEGDSLVTMEQLDAANPCSVIYHRAGDRFGHNGSCDTNATAERMTYAAFCDGDSSCARWPMARHVYRIPSAPRLTPGERVEEMVRRLDGTTVTETVPAPAELGGWLTELSDSMSDEEQRPTYEQVQSGIAAIGRTLARTNSAADDTGADTAPDTAPVAAAGTEPDTTFTEDDVPGDEPIARPTSAEDEEHATSTSAGATTSILTNPALLWSIIAILSVAMILLLFKDNIRAWFRPIVEDEQEKPAPDLAPPAPTMEQVRDNKMYVLLKRCWSLYYRQLNRNDELTEDSLALFFDTADTNRVLVGTREERIKELERLVDALSIAKTALPLAPPEPKIEYRVDTKRVDELEGQLAEANVAKTLAEDAKAAALAGLELIKVDFDIFKAGAKRLVDTYYQDGAANLGLALDNASRTGDTSAPSLMNALERISHAREMFNGMARGLLNDLMIHLESDLAMVPSSPGIPLYHDRVSTSEHEVPNKALEDSWTGTLDGKVSGTEGFQDLARELEPASIPPKDGDMSIPPKEALSGEPTHPGVRPPEPGHIDDVVFRASQHAPRPSGKGGRAKKRRDRKITDSFEREPVAKAIEAEASKSPRDDEPTAVFHQDELDRKRLEARTGKTITPGGSLIPPPPPIVAPVVDQGEEPDPTEVGSRDDLSKPASTSLFDEQHSSFDESATRKVVGKDS